MNQLDEFAKDVVDRYIKAMGYNPQTIDRNRRMALTKTIRFQQFAQRMRNEQLNTSPTMTNKPYTKGLAQSRVHTKDMAIKRSVHVNKPQLAVKTEALEFPADDGISPKGSSSKVVGERRKGMSKNANLIKALYKKHKVKKEVKEELYDHEKDDKDGGTYGQKPKFAKVKVGQQEDQSDSKPKAAAVLTGGTTLTGQKRDDVEFDPMLGKPNIKSDASGMQIKAKKKDK